MNKANFGSRLNKLRRASLESTQGKRSYSYKTSVSEVRRLVWVLTYVRRRDSSGSVYHNGHPRDLKTGKNSHIHQT